MNMIVNIIRTKRIYAPKEEFLKSNQRILGNAI